jgi:alpha-N-acetylglucosaminidase
MLLRGSSPVYLRASNAAIYSAMTSIVPNAVFVMQGWLFYNAEAFWTDDRIPAYLSGVPDTRMLILDLFTDVSPLWSCPGMQSYFGKPFVWNMLQYFGGRRGLYGNLSRIGEQPLVDLHNPNGTMVGLGITPESTEMGIPFFDLIWDMPGGANPPPLRIGSTTGCFAGMACSLRPCRPRGRPCVIQTTTEIAQTRRRSPCAA